MEGTNQDLKFQFELWKNNSIPAGILTSIPAGGYGRHADIVFRLE